MSSEDDQDNDGWSSPVSHAAINAKPADPGQPITKANGITMAEIEALQAANRAVTEGGSMFLTVSAVAKILNTSEGNVRALERKGTLRATRTSSGERLFKPKDVDRAKQLRAKVQGRDVRATANVRPAVNEPDWLADSIAAQFSASRLDAIRAFYKHRPRGDAWFLVEIVDDTLAALKSLRALIHDLGVQDADDSWNEAIARADAVIARAEGK